MTAHWGAANGAIAGLLGCGALLTTLGTMITVRGLFTLASQAKLVEISTSTGPTTWDWIGFEQFLPCRSASGLADRGGLVSVMFRQTRSWHILAVGATARPRVTAASAASCGVPWPMLAG